MRRNQRHHSQSYARIPLKYLRHAKYPAARPLKE